MPPAVRAGVTPKRNADRDIGEWNTFEITMRGDRLTVVLNGEEVISDAQLPGVAAARADRAAAPRREERRRLGQPAEPGPVPQHLHQGDVARSAA